MKKVRPGSPAPDVLRVRAEKRLRESRVGETPAGGSEEDPSRLLHELRVHQVELEMQNEELMRSRDAAKALLKRYLDLYEFAPVGYFTLDAGGVIRQANLAGSSLLGVPREKLDGRRLALFLAQESRQAFADLLARVMSGDHSVTCDASLPRAGGGTAHVQLGGEAFEGVPECRIAMVDVTGRRETEEALRRSEERFRTIFTQAPLGVALIDSDTGRICEVNPRFAEIAGRTREEMAAVDWMAVTHPEDVQKDQDQMDLMNAGRIPGFNMDRRYRRPDGSYVWIDMTIAPITVEGDRRQHLCMIKDISERKRMERRVERRTASLAEANRELEAFSYSVSHELRTPLRAIDGFSARISRGYEGLLDDEGQRLFGQVRWNAQRMGQLIDDLLAFSQAGRGDLHLATVDMTRIAKTAFAEVVPDPASLGRISLSVGDLPEARGDALLLRRVWANLLSNAVKFSAARERPEIRVEGKAVEGEVVYSVGDNGVGFDMKYVDRLFGVFQRLHGQHEFEGTGVGLALVRRIVSRHGGRVWAEGKVNEGATFFFTLGPA